MRIPFFAHHHVATMSAVGVASPNAHGHEITITAVAYNNAVSKETHCHSRRTKKVMSETAKTKGTKN